MEKIAVIDMGSNSAKLILAYVWRMVTTTVISSCSMNCAKQSGLDKIWNATGI